jgi:bifunctional oligoribonuclease and PAP phosphatase NrnA
MSYNSPSNLKFAKAEKIAWSTISKKHLSNAKAKDEDADPLANDILSISTVKAAILFREIEGGLLRVSLRSKDNINIAQLARVYNGGGHFNSAGCHIENKESAVKLFIKQAKELLD